MRVPGFIFGSYESQAFTADQERTVNWYVEPMESTGATTRAALYPTPGVDEVANTATRSGIIMPGRAHFFEAKREFMVIGDSLYEAEAYAPSEAFPVLTFRGTVGDDPTPATISSNGDGGGQLFITSASNGFCFDLSTNTLTQITALDGRATMGGFLDGYFLALDATASTLYLSALFDGASWTTGLDFAQRSVASDPWISMKVLGRYVWLLGQHTSEAWYNTGATFPLALHPSSLIRYGIAAPWSVAASEDSLLWLHASSFGAGQVIQARGFSPQVVSNFAVATDINDTEVPFNARADVYSDFGHTFYLLRLPGLNKTWVYDLTTRLWHERGTWIYQDNTFRAWRPSHFVRAFGELRALDSGGGSLYRVSPNIGTDVDDLSIRRVRRAPAIVGENQRIFYSSFELDLERGQGTTAGQAENPQVMMRMSNDGGRTWGAERMRSAGKIGEYGKRVRWNRLGMARRRVFEVSTTDPIPWKITNAYVELDQQMKVQPVGASGA